MKSVEAGKNVLVFLVWTVTSFACHASAKRFLSAMVTKEGGESSGDLPRTVLLAFQLTATQLGLCYALTSVQVSAGNLVVARISHVLATLATNLSMAFMFASSTFAIKLMEPITSAVVQYFYLGTPLSPWAIASLPVIVTGALGFSGIQFQDTDFSLGTLMAFASNIILAFRNLALKKNQPENQTTVVLRKSVANVPVLSSVLFSVALVLYSGHWAGVLTTRMTSTTALCLLSSVFHVVYSYVSTGIVLAQLSVVSHAVCNIMKRVLVVLMLYAIGQRQATLAHFSYLALSTAGLALYTWDKTRAKRDTAQDKDSTGFPRMSAINGLRMSRLLLLFPLGAILLTSCVTLYYTSPPRLLRANFLSLPVLEQTRRSQDDLISYTFSNRAYRRPNDSELAPDLDGYLKPHKEEIQAFLNERLVNSPERAGFLSEKLRTHAEVIKEAQRLHFNILGDVLKKYKVAMLLDIAAFENKGDPAITVGEILFLARINLPIVYYCGTTTCYDQNLKKARELASNYTKDELVILNHGGGNIIGYASQDVIRFKIMDLFAGYDMMVFPQSIWVTNVHSPHVKKCEQRYCCNENLTLVLRDSLSYAFAKEHFKGTTRLIMAPDMAFQIGHVNRFQSPVFDVLWIRRRDGERVHLDSMPSHPADIRFHVSDWFQWKTNRAPGSLESAFYVEPNGFKFLSRGRVVVTDRLHGHILSTLMNIPHVILDNKYKKVSSYHNTWTKGIENIEMTNDPEEAMALVLSMLKRYEEDVPPRVPFMNISEKFLKVDWVAEEFDKYA